MSDRHPVWVLLDKLQMDNRAQAAKLTELRALVSSLNLPDPNRRACPSCGAVHTHQQALAEHVYRVHDGPVPAHYLEAERRAGLEVEA